MKTAIVPVEIYDNVHSVRDKVLWSPSDRILLVLPRHHRQFPSRMDLHLLKRSAEKNGGLLAIVCRDARTCVYAESLDIQIFRSIPSAERSSWQKIKPSQTGFGRRKGKTEISAMRDALPRKGINRGMPIGLLIGVVLAMLALTFSLLPSTSGFLDHSDGEMVKSESSNMTQVENVQQDSSTHKFGFMAIFDALRMQQQGISREEAIQELNSIFPSDDMGETNSWVTWWTNLPFWQSFKPTSGDQ